MGALRFAELREGVWLRPRNLPADVLPAAEAIVAARCTLLDSRPLDPADLVDRLWDLPAWAQRATALQRLGKNVLVSKFGAFHRLGSYLSRHTQEPVGLVLSLDVLEKLFEDKWYEDLPGGILENFGRLFKHQLRLYVYPILDRDSGQTRSLSKAEIADTLRSLFAHLTENQRILSIAGSANKDLLKYWTTDIRRMMSERDDRWKALVPPEVIAAYTPA